MLFGEKPRQLAAGIVAATSPTLATDHLYHLQLKAQSEVTFVRQPGKIALNGAQTYAGLARLTLEITGVYRIALDQGLWVDVIANNTIVQTKDFQGAHGCTAPHKIVEFLLPARTPMTLQFSGGRGPAVNVTVTRSPAG